MEILIQIQNIIIGSFVRFPLELLIAEVPFLVNQRRNRGFVSRLILGIVIYMICCGLWGYVILIPTDGQQGFDIYSFLRYFVWALFSIIPIYLAFDMQFIEILFAVASGYATEHMCFGLTTILIYYIGMEPNERFSTYILFHYASYVVWDVIIYYIIVKKNIDKNHFRKNDRRISILFVVVMVAAIGLSLAYSNAEVSFLSRVVCPSYSFMCCGLVLVMEYYVLRENQMLEEQHTMEQLLQMADNAHKSNKEAIDIINIKCHDLKHQLKALTKLEDNKERNEYIKEVQQAVSIYDATYHTGCETLDYVLREKTLISNERDVAFSCMTDGKLIDFMTPTDIYALMGNAFDNALESVVKEKPEERVISLHIKERGDMVLIHMENRCSREIQFIDGLPVTTKDDKSYHGFGVKSIKYITEKYGGSILMSTKNGKFYLDIILPKAQ